MPFLNGPGKESHVTVETMKLRRELTVEELQRIFKRHDKNGDGRLDMGELKKAFDELGAVVPMYRAWRGLKCADADGDGFVTKREMNNLVQYAFHLGYTIDD